MLMVPKIDQLSDDPALLSAFGDWMRRERGACDATSSAYAPSIREFLGQFGEKPSRWDAHSLRSFVLQKSRVGGCAAAKRCTTALRAFVRFLIADGQCAVGLDAAIPTVAHWRLAALPRYVQPDDVERAIASCDQTSSLARRNRAILLLLARLGLRAGDIVDLRLSDIDWKDASIQVSGKSHRQTRLPLTQEVGQAIVTYLQHGRPRTTTEALFVRNRPPFRGFSSSTAVTKIVLQALNRAGVVRPRGSVAHLLRHSLATSMLREGATLQDIGALLRHRSMTTTQIYAKVDVMALRAIAQPWPEVSPCS